jgi:hypothetical protein
VLPLTSITLFTHLCIFQSHHNSLMDSIRPW